MVAPASDFREPVLPLDPHPLTLSWGQDHEAASKRQAFGGKSIGTFAGVALLVNNITGPGIPQLPNIFAEAGWLMPTLCIFAIWAASTVSAAMYCEAMRKIPGNEHFVGNIEYSTIVKHYFGRGWYVASQVGLNGALQALNIISVVQSAQVMDSAISMVFGTTCGLNLTPFQGVWTDGGGASHNVAGSTDVFSCVDMSNIDTGNPWGCHVVISAGYLLVMAMAVPCGRWNLDDNMNIQVVAASLTACCWGIWIAGSLSKIGELEATPGLPAVNSDADTGSQAAWLGTILFNFGFVTTVPSWVNEKRPHVSVNRSIWTATTLCIGVFFAVGLPGALAFRDVLQGPSTNTCASQVTNPSVNCANDLLQALTGGLTEPSSWASGAFTDLLLRVSVYIFPVVAVVSSIPVFSIVIKYNMIENGFSRTTGFVWAVLFPWTVGFPLLYMPNVLAQFVNFTSLIFVTFTDFVVPLALYINLQRRRRQGGGAGAVAVSVNTGAARTAGTGGGGDGGTFEVVGCPAPQNVEVESVVDQSLVDAGVRRAHYAVPRFLGLSSRGKIACAAIIALFLSISAAVSAVLTVVQGDYALNAQVCALVGN